MKVSYPLSFKVSVWLLLNLLLLGGLAFGFVVVSGGIGWNALLAGRTGNRVNAKINAIANEMAVASTTEERTATLLHYSEEHSVQLALYRAEEPRLIGPTMDLPPSIQSRVDVLRNFGRGPFREFGGPGGRGRGPGGPPPDFRGPQGSRGDGPRREPPPFDEKDRKEWGGGRGPPPGERENFRMIDRAGTPPSYWMALRVGSAGGERLQGPPAVMVVRVDSFWQLLSFLELESWVLAGALVLGLSVLFWLPLVRNLTQHISRLTYATEQIAEGHFETRITGERRDELGKLGESVNRMAARLDAHMTGQKRFLGDVAHELCSPLARLQMATGILAEQAPKNLQPTIDDVRDEVQQMSTLVNELLAFTKAGLKPREVVLSTVDVGTMALAAAAREDIGSRTSVQVPADLKVKAEPDLLGRAIGNLIRNAIRYSGDKTPVTVHARRQGERVVITVDDEGPGVPASALDRLGEPFFRPEEARTRESGGVGLGLAIVRTSITSCGGEVRFSNRTPRGFRAEVTLPVASA